MFPAHRYLNNRALPSLQCCATFLLLHKIWVWASEVLLNFKGGLKSLKLCCRQSPFVEDPEELCVQIMWGCFRWAEQSKRDQRPTNPFGFPCWFYTWATLITAEGLLLSRSVLLCRRAPSCHHHFIFFPVGCKDKMSKPFHCAFAYWHHLPGRTDGAMSYSAAEICLSSGLSSLQEPRGNRAEAEAAANLADLLRKPVVLNQPSQKLKNVKCDKVWHYRAYVVDLTCEVVSNVLPPLHQLCSEHISLAPPTRCNQTRWQTHRLLCVILLH